MHAYTHVWNSTGSISCMDSLPQALHVHAYTNVWNSTGSIDGKRIQVGIGVGIGSGLGIGDWGLRSGLGIQVGLR